MIDWLINWLIILFFIHLFLPPIFIYFSHASNIIFYPKVTRFVLSDLEAWSTNLCQLWISRLAEGIIDIGKLPKRHDKHSHHGFHRVVKYVVFLAAEYHKHGWNVNIFQIRIEDNYNLCFDFRSLYPTVCRSYRREASTDGSCYSWCTVGHLSKDTLSRKDTDPDSKYWY